MSTPLLSSLRELPPGTATAIGSWPGTDPVEASRVLLGVHYLSDVVAGTLAGLVWVAATAVVLLGWRPGRRRPRRVSAAPISLRWVRRAR